MVHSWSLLNGVSGGRSDRTLKTTPDGQFRGVNSRACQANFSLLSTTKNQNETNFARYLRQTTSAPLVDGVVGRCGVVAACVGLPVRGTWDNSHHNLDLDLL